MYRKYYHIKFILTFLITVFFYLSMIAQDWDITADKKEKNAYFKFTAETIAEGGSFYSKNCQSCHGNPGKDNSLKTLNPIPPDLASIKTQKRTDGELFFIISTGRLIMPSFKNILSEEERWKLISYIRSFSKEYIQIISKSNTSKSKLVKIKIDFDSLTYQVKVDAKANDSAGIVSLKDAEVMLFAQRYFGKLQIDKTFRTNNEGIAVFNFPKDLPGDKGGYVDLIVKVNDEVYGEIESQEKLKVGIPTDKPGLTEKRAIWNVLTKAPIWIIITYTSIVFAVGFVLLFILYKLMKLRKLGNNQSEKV